MRGEGELGECIHFGVPKLSIYVNSVDFFLELDEIYFEWRAECNFILREIAKLKPPWFFRIKLLMWLPVFPSIYPDIMFLFLLFRPESLHSSRKLFLFHFECKKLLFKFKIFEVCENNLIVFHIKIKTQIKN